MRGEEGEAPALISEVEKEEDGNVPAGSSTVEKEPIHCLMMSSGDSPSLSGLDCKTLGGNLEQSTSTLLTLEAAGKNLVMTDWCPGVRDEQLECVES
jgi:hypothetical protein